MITKNCDWQSTCHQTSGEIFTSLFNWQSWEAKQVAADPETPLLPEKGDWQPGRHACPVPPAHPEPGAAAGRAPGGPPPPTPTTQLPEDRGD